ncbi:uncharacterized protein K452DRAFT_286141 [Aplosporella prunicola CBS 121167]|uniref:F-box domain-containing protein n=1 Tax=Aplosporella prunicola CBS 121167 TaxID=1176127 RepID=A0A6A6BGM6_9PEZI|nr:uncharacterized protein K452DRAFT_286141 [Aplosporella prunicola CBS 121167]KAF2143310.1 hypothetical protein K452DRAFT_286141 [Aplosporella prunicola CBS 121167]
MERLADLSLESWTVLLGTLALAAALSLPLLVREIRQRQAASPTLSFGFTKLPAEIRDMVYEELVESDPVYPAPLALRRRPGSLAWFLQQRKPAYTKCGILLASRQLHAEFVEVLCKKANFKLTIDRSNEKEARLWPLPAETMRRIRKCEVRIVATSAMLGSRDPRSMPREWALRDRVSRNLASMAKVESLKLHVHAVPDRMWNPLWLWSQVSQQFKDLEQPRFHRITFGIESWSLGENHLQRDGEGRWRWECPGQHTAVDDAQGWQPIREFCAALYLECRQCQLGRDS